jgi:hypothetical protein
MPQHKWRLVDLSIVAYTASSDTILPEWWPSLSSGKAVLHGVLEDWGDMSVCSEFRFVSGHMISIDGVGKMREATVVPVGHPWLETND